MPELSERGYDCLRDALNMARNDGVRSVKALRAKLATAGYEPAAIDEALDTWAGSVVTRLMPDND